MRDFKLKYTRRFATRTIVEKPSKRTRLVKFTGIVGFFVLLFYSTNNLYNKQIEQRQASGLNQHLVAKAQILGTETQIDHQGFPVHLIIPAINVDADIQQVGITDEGEMATPNSFVQAGWFKLGTRPGEIGNAVIAGHLNGKDGEVGVFANLSKLKKGDNLYIKDDKGALITFVVRETRTYDPGHADDVFGSSNSSQLNLITCDGDWDDDKQSYSKRLVVFTDKVMDE